MQVVAPMTQINRNIICFWFLFTGFTLVVPIILNQIKGRHEAFFYFDITYSFQFLYLIFLYLGAFVAAYTKTVNVCVAIPLKRGVFHSLLAIGLVIIAISHIYIAATFGLRFRHSMPISDLGAMAYLYVIEIFVQAPLVVLMLRIKLSGRGEYKKGLLIAINILAITMLLKPYNLNNFVVGVSLLVINMCPRRSLVFFSVPQFVLVPIFGFSVLFFATYFLKGLGPSEGFETIARYLQYRYTIWLAASELLLDRPWVELFSIYSENFMSDLSINTQTASLIYSGEFTNARVGSGAGIVGSSLFILPYPGNFILVSCYSFFITYILKTSRILHNFGSLLVQILVFAIVFPFTMSPIQLASFEIFPLLHFFVLVIAMSVRIRALG